MVLREKTSWKAMGGAKLKVNGPEMYDRALVFSGSAQINGRFTLTAGRPLRTYLGMGIRWCGTRKCVNEMAHPGRRRRWLKWKRMSAWIKKEPLAGKKSRVQFSTPPGPRVSRAAGMARDHRQRGSHRKDHEAQEMSHRMPQIGVSGIYGRRPRGRWRDSQARVRRRRRSTWSSSNIRIRYADPWTPRRGWWSTVGTHRGSEAGLKIWWRHLSMLKGTDTGMCFVSRKWQRPARQWHKKSLRDRVDTIGSTTKPRQPEGTKRGREKPRTRRRWTRDCSIFSRWYRTGGKTRHSRKSQPRDIWQWHSTWARLGANRRRYISGTHIGQTLGATLRNGWRPPDSYSGHEDSYKPASQREKCGA